MIYGTKGRVGALVVWGVVSGLVALGCSKLDNFVPCPPGYNLWMCTVVIWVPGVCDCGVQRVAQPSCAKSKAQAESNVRFMIKDEPPLAGAKIFSMDCEDTGARSAQSETPSYKFQDNPAECDVFDGDNACLACAKASCCGQFQACAGDTNCICWVGCKYGGNADSVCADATHCGPANGISSAMAACLDSACPTCPTSSSTDAICTCNDSSSSSSGGPSCVPGNFAAGDPCFSDGDCASCNCDPQTATCG